MHRINSKLYKLSNDTTLRLFQKICVELWSTKVQWVKKVNNSLFDFFWGHFSKNKKVESSPEHIGFKMKFFSARKPSISCLGSFWAKNFFSRLLSKKSKKKSKKVKNQKIKKMLKNRKKVKKFKKSQKIQKKYKKCK